MIRLWLVFGILFAAFYFGITAWRNLKGKERWNLTKTAIYSIICSILAVASMTLIVILF
jgi:cytochrome c oxidase assembly factor CtaG